MPFIHSDHYDQDFVTSKKRKRDKKKFKTETITYSKTTKLVLNRVEDIYRYFFLFFFFKPVILSGEGGGGV